MAEIQWITRQSFGLRPLRRTAELGSESTLMFDDPVLTSSTIEMGRMRPTGCVFFAAGGIG
ncbi:hypothetical protein F6X42_39875 [Paraburkholderia sp. WC7.3b]|uniref:Uncharacterized protein n=1 Tax=Paraburkholderia podalyriae TaxID=1938811 RepID=A0ABR7Q1C7_9BURK|nr:hypothetical protein [Paraburkholderia podalyriae]